MRSIVIVDDEYIVVEGIKAIIEIEHMKYQVIGCAYNGEDGVQIIQQLKPEIVITDIRMPGKTGLEMIEELEKKGIKPEYIVISGFQEFEYARTALQLGVLSYIDKPITISSVKEALLSAEQILAKKAAHFDVIYKQEKKRSFEEACQILTQSIVDQKVDYGMEQVEAVLKRLKEYAPELEEYKQEAYKMVCYEIGVFSETNTESKTEQHMPSFENVKNIHDRDEMNVFVKEIFNSIFSKIDLLNMGDVHIKIKIALQYMEENYGRDIGLAEVAEIAGIHYIYMSKLFKEEMGMSFVKYLTKIRLDHAKEFLEKGYRINYVAELTGFSNYRYFCDIFKKYEGITPSQFKGNVRKINKS